MDAFTFLRNDHESVLGMCEVLDGAPQGKGAQLSGLRTMVTDLVVAESRHEAIEQQFFWPLVRERLEDGNPGEPEYHGALVAFIEAGRKHIAYEQNVVWPRMAAALSESELQDLGATLARARQKAPTRPHPDTPSGPGAQKTMGAAAAELDKLRDAVTGRSDPPDPPTS
ncbi:hemerythrin domain-containing protein [Rhodococcus zopfii]